MKPYYAKYTSTGNVLMVVLHRASNNTDIPKPSHCARLMINERYLRLDMELN